jgi:hypothetical protein
MFYSLMQLIGVGGLHAEMIWRKFYIVYGHPLFAALMLGLVVLAFRRDRILTVCLGGSGPYVLLGVLFVVACYTKFGSWLAASALILWLLLLRPVARARGVVFAIYLVFAGLYVVVVGSLFFNIPGLPHAQFHWGALRYLGAMAWSLGLAIIPAGVLYLAGRLSRRSDAPSGKVCLLTTAVFHIAMAGFYIPMQVPVE